MTESPFAEKSTLGPCVAFLLCILGALAFLFWPGIENPALTVWSADYGMDLHRLIVEGSRSWGGFEWHQHHFLGSGNTDGALLAPSWLVLALTPSLGVSMWLNIAFHMLVAGLGAWICARAMGVSRWGAALSGVAYGLTTHLISLIYPGHVAKIQAIPWIPWALGFFWKAWQTGRFRDFLLTALSLAAAWQSGEPQVPLYLSLYVAGMAAFLFLRAAFRRDGAQAGGRPLLHLTLLSVACAFLTGLLAFQSLSTFAGYLVNMRPATAPLNAPAAAPAPEEGYKFSTGWSFPPEDTLTLLMTGQLLGGKSPAYFGRMGTDDMKLKQTDDYVGVLVFVLALVGLSRLRRENAAGFLLFMLLSSLVIGFGRYTPLYRILYSLPMMASQRVPARWLAFTVCAFSILAGFGLDRFIQVCREGTAPLLKRFAAIPAAMAALAIALLGIAAMMGANGSDFAQRAFGPQGFLSASTVPQLAEMRAQAFAGAVNGTAVLLLLGALLLGAGLFAQRPLAGSPLRKYSLAGLAGACVLFTAVDLTRNAGNFVEFYNWEDFHREDSLVTFFKRDPDLFRIQPVGVQNHPVLNRLVGPVGSWQRLRFTEQTAMHRIEPQFETFFQNVTAEGLPNYRFSPRYYDVFNVKYVLSAFNLPPEILSKSRLQLLQTIPFSQGLPPLYLYRYTGFAPNPALVSQSVTVPTEADVMKTICSPDFDINHAVVGTNLPAMPAAQPGQTKLQSFGPRQIDIETDAASQQWLVCRERFTTDWRATLDGSPAKLYQLNFFHFGTPVPAGKHTVRIEYAPSRMPFKLTASAWILAIGSLAAIWLAQLRRSKNLTRAH